MPCLLFGTTYHGLFTTSLIVLLTFAGSVKSACTNPDLTNCAQYTKVETCIADSKCGWSWAKTLCGPGTATGPDCTTDDWTKCRGPCGNCWIHGSTAPSGTTDCRNLPTSPLNCVKRPGCGWNNENLACYPGDQKGTCWDPASYQKCNGQCANCWNVGADADVPADGDTCDNSKSPLACVSRKGCGWTNGAEECRPGDARGVCWAQSWGVCAGWDLAAGTCSNCWVYNTSAPVPSTGLCKDLKTPKACVDANGCAWNNQHETCFPGDRVRSCWGPDYDDCDGKCGNCYNYGSTSAVPATGTCKDYKTPAECVGMQGCGWSNWKSDCSPGDRAGTCWAPDDWAGCDGTCGNCYVTYDQPNKAQAVPASGQCSALLTPETCVQVSGCGWSWQRMRCGPGDAKGPCTKSWSQCVGACGNCWETDAKTQLCTQFNQNPSACASSPSCGWSNLKMQCFPGDDTDPCPWSQKTSKCTGTCGNCWISTKNSVYAPVSACSNANTCKACSSIIGCGWSTSQAKCVPGDCDGACDAKYGNTTCSGPCGNCWIYRNPAACPPESDSGCAQFTSQENCISGGGCGWNTDTNKCSQGDALGSCTLQDQACNTNTDRGSTFKCYVGDPGRSGPSPACSPSAQAPTANVCGDGNRREQEECDDGNVVSGDGCSSTCYIEDGYTCSKLVVGVPDTCAMCGNGKREGPEECDDGPVDGQGTCPPTCTPVSGDGCSNVCTIEQGWECDTKVVPNKCTRLPNGGVPFVCGDGLRQGTEQCDDGNLVVGDGCSNCTVDINWTCDASTPNRCNQCGNGKTEGTEECDDGSTTPGDGCDGDCQVEAGYHCSANPTLVSVCQASCNDGIRSLYEQCDDRSYVRGDGCSEHCEIEPGYVCSLQVPNQCVQISLYTDPAFMITYWRGVGSGENSVVTRNQYESITRALQALSAPGDGSTNTPSSTSQFVLYDYIVPIVPVDARGAIAAISTKALGIRVMVSSLQQRGDVRYVPPTQVIRGLQSSVIRATRGVVVAQSVGSTDDRSDNEQQQSTTTTSPSSSLAVNVPGEGTFELVGLIEEANPFRSDVEPGQGVGNYARDSRIDANPLVCEGVSCSDNGVCVDGVCYCYAWSERYGSACESSPRTMMGVLISVPIVVFILCLLYGTKAGSKRLIPEERRKSHLAWRFDPPNTSDTVTQAADTASAHGTGTQLEGSHDVVAPIADKDTVDAQHEKSRAAATQSTGTSSATEGTTAAAITGDDPPLFDEAIFMSSRNHQCRTSKSGGNVFKMVLLAYEALQVITLSVFSEYYHQVVERANEATKKAVLIEFSFQPALYASVGVAGVAVLLSLVTLIVMRSKKFQVSPDDTLTTVLIAFYQPLLSATFLPTCRRLLSVFACTYTDPRPPYLDADPSIECWTSEHVPIIGMGLVLIPYVPLAMWANVVLQVGGGNGAIRVSPAATQNLQIGKVLLAIGDTMFSRVWPVRASFVFLASGFILLWAFRRVKTADADGAHRRLVPFCIPPTVARCRRLVYQGAIMSLLCSMVAVALRPDQSYGIVPPIVLAVSLALVAIEGTLAVFKPSLVGGHKALSCPLFIQFLDKRIASVQAKMAGRPGGDGKDTQELQRLDEKRV